MAREELAAVTLPRRSTQRLLPETGRAFHSPLPSVFPWAPAGGWGWLIRTSPWSRGSAKFKPGASGLGNLRAQPRRHHQGPLPECELEKCSLMRWDNSFHSLSAKEKQLFISSRKFIVSVCTPMQQIFFPHHLFKPLALRPLCPAAVAGCNYFRSTNKGSTPSATVALHVVVSPLFFSPQVGIL